VTDWAELEHAYGPATDLPPLLAAIEKGSAAAVESLRNKVAHQGLSSPEAARAVATHLLEMAPSLKGQTLAAVIRLLADLACAGSHEHFMGTGFVESGVAPLLEEPSVAATRALLASHDAAPWLTNRSAHVRSAAALFITFTGQEESEALLSRLKKEKKAEAVVDLLLSLGWAASEPLPELVAAQDDARAAVSTAAWIATAMASPELNEDIVAGLQLAALADPIGCAWAEGDLRRLAVDILRHRARKEGRPDALYGLLDGVEPIQRTRIGATLLWHVFRDELAGYQLGVTKDATDPPPLESLNDEQKSVLRLLTRYDTGWGHSGDQVVVLRILGLPRNPPEMLLYLGDPPPPPDQRDVPFEACGHEGTFAEVLVAVCTKDNHASIPELVRASRETFDTEELLDVVELSQQPIVPWGFTRSAWTVHLLVDAGPELVPALRERLERYCRSGVPSFWNAHGKIRAAALPILLWAALLQLDPKAELPKNFPIGRSDRTRWNAQLEQFEPKAASWIRKALRKT
jgi:hypothetical protein